MSSALKVGADIGQRTNGKRKEQTMSKDIIYREDAIKALDNAWINGTSLLDANEAVKQLNDLPSADRPSGEWKRRLVDNGFNADYVCSECGYRVKTDFVDYNYCPHCGCRMKGADDES